MNHAVKLRIKLHCATALNHNGKGRNILDFTALLNTVVTLALLIAVGFGLRKRDIINDTASKKLSELIIKVGQPMLIISSLISLEYSAENLRRGLFTLILSFAMHAFMGIIAFLVSKSVRDIDERKITQLATVFTNCAFVGFPILKSIFGDGALFCGAFYLVGFHLFVWTLGIYIISRGRDDIKLTPKKIFINYGTVPSIIGFVLFLLHVRLPDFIGMTASYLSSLCTPISVLITGALIATGSLRELFGRAENYIVSAIKLILIPMLVCIALKLCGLDHFYIVFGTVMAAMPSASVITMLGEMYSVKPAYASRLVGVTSVLCVITLPLMVAFADFMAKL